MGHRREQVVGTGIGGMKDTVFRATSTTSTNTSCLCYFVPLDALLKPVGQPKRHTETFGNRQHQEIANRLIASIPQSPEPLYSFETFAATIRAVPACDQLALALINGGSQDLPSPQSCANAKLLGAARFLVEFQEQFSSRPLEDARDENLLLHQLLTQILKANPLCLYAKCNLHQRLLTAGINILDKFISRLGMTRAGVKADWFAARKSVIEPHVSNYDVADGLEEDDEDEEGDADNEDDGEDDDDDDNEDVDEGEKKDEHDDEEEEDDEEDQEEDEEQAIDVGEVSSSSDIYSSSSDSLCFSEGD